MLPPKDLARCALLAAGLTAAAPSAGQEAISIHCGRYNCASRAEDVQQEVIQWENKGAGIWGLIGTSITITYRPNGTPDYLISHPIAGTRTAPDRRSAMDVAVQWARDLAANGIEP